MSILEAIQLSTGFLAGKGVPSPRLQVELLLAQLLGVGRMDLYLNFERALQPKELDALRAMVRRRGQREPLQYILGNVCFCGIELRVNANVLAPRAETELLAEEAWRFLRASSGAWALDLCTGSGCLAIALAMHAAQAGLHATDICGPALDVARENASRHQVQERIQFHQGDMFAAVPAGRRFDLIVCNPPYIPSQRIAGLEPEVRDYEPRQALDGGRDGLDFYRRIAAQAGAFLQAGGRLMVELDEETAAKAVDLFRAERWGIEAVRNDYSERPRILIAQLPGR